MKDRLSTSAALDCLPRCHQASSPVVASLCPLSLSAAFRQVAL
jgi:hypothetical protein